MELSPSGLKAPLVARRAHSDTADTRRREVFLEKYLASCRDHQIIPSGEALIRLQLRCESLCVRPNPSKPPFGDLELRPLVALLEGDEGLLLQGLRSLDLSGCRLGPAGVMLIAQMLLHPSCRLEELSLSGQRIGLEGALALAQALRASNTLKVVRLHSCGLGTDGGCILAEFLNEEHDSLSTLDLQNNFIPFGTCEIIRKRAEARGISVLLTGNRVLDEVLNAVSHGIGVIFAIVAAVFLGIAVSEKPRHYKVSVVPYCMSLIVLYLASTLYHSFHALGPTVVRVFGILDHTAIYFLIAGSYTPFLGIMLSDEWWSQVLLGGMWSTAAIGVAITAFYHGRFKVPLELALYILMGWAALGCLGQMLAKLSVRGSVLLICGGVLYTVGVPWFVRDAQTFGIPDHTLWHLLVLCASILHFFCIYFDVVLV